MVDNPLCDVCGLPFVRPTKKRKICKKCAADERRAYMKTYMIDYMKKYRK